MESKDENIKLIQKALVKWYKEFGRDFYWRRSTATNFEKIISEVLLQRTKAETVNRYYQLFFSRYKSWEHLGNATREELEEILKPLGLYRQKSDRLFKLAQELKIRDYVFPRKRHQLEEMSFMGQYITNAYELLILKRRKPLIDVNMARFIERFFGQRSLSDIRYDPKIQSIANLIVQTKDSQLINWAILDFANLVCKLKEPKCISCILNCKCEYYFLSSQTTDNNFSKIPS